MFADDPDGGKNDLDVDCSSKMKRLILFNDFTKLHHVWSDNTRICITSARAAAYFEQVDKIHPVATVSLTPPFDARNHGHRGGGRDGSLG